MVSPRRREHAAGGLPHVDLQASGPAATGPRGPPGAAWPQRAATGLVKVKAHAGNQLSEAADILATAASELDATRPTELDPEGVHFRYTGTFVPWNSRHRQPGCWELTEPDSGDDGPSLRLSTGGQWEAGSIRESTYWGSHCRMTWQRTGKVEQQALGAPAWVEGGDNRLLPGHRGLVKREAVAGGPGETQGPPLQHG